MLLCFVSGEDIGKDGHWLNIFAFSLNTVNFQPSSFLVSSVSYTVPSLYLYILAPPFLILGYGIDSRDTLLKKRPYSKLFWFIFSRILTKHGEISEISPYWVRMRENADQNNSKYGHFSLSDILYSRSYTRSVLLWLPNYPNTRRLYCSTFWWKKFVWNSDIIKCYVNINNTTCIQRALVIFVCTEVYWRLMWGMF